jgi:hypothetical protein
VPAQHLNTSGIIGAAMNAAEIEEPSASPRPWSQVF